MKQLNTLTYFQANMPQQGLSLQFSNMEELIRYIAHHHINTVFVLAKDEVQYFACMQQGIFIGHPSLGFNSIEDYKEAAKGHFPDAAWYYEAKNSGYEKYVDYQLVKEAGISDISIFENLKSQGYLDGFQAFKMLQSDQPLFEGSEAITNPYLLYQHAISKAFENYHDFKTALDLGFTDAHHYHSALEKGFKNHFDYENGLLKGFATGEIYYAALDKKIRDIEDLNRFLELSQLETMVTHFDERLLLSVIGKLPQGKKVSINKLNELFFKALDAYKYPDTGELPEWFTRSLFTIQDITHFLTIKDNAKNFGFYDTEGEYFETKQLNQRKVVLDGSNIAHGTMGNDKGKPLVANMIKVVNKLIDKGFTAITIIADASLRHKLADMEKMEALEKLCEYRMAPAETAADVFLIEFVKIEGCLLVSNDTFREWKLKDKWVAENIDYYKMAFMIEGDKVLMPDLDVEVG